MLVGLSIKNFKSIRSARVRFGALTCVIGHNGVGKSNLFDAIHLLSELSEREIHDAAGAVRRTADGSSSPLDLVFGRDPSNQIELTADMIVPDSIEDDFGLEAEPSTTLLTYQVRLRYEAGADRLVVASETLTHAKRTEFRLFATFPASKGFEASVALGVRRGGPLISTTGEQISLHGDGGSRGRPAPVGRSPRTVLGGTNTADYPTVLAAKREMASWRLLHLEPTSMRAPDMRGAPRHVSASGGHLPATLRALKDSDADSRVEVLNRLHELNSDVADLDIYVDEVRDQLALRARIPGISEWLFGRSLSDGTLRYIALALMLADVDDRAVLCIEEPENGIHPSRIPALVDLLYDYAVDLDEEVAEHNPLRQVILNTHSPEVARQLGASDIIFAERATSGDGVPISVFRPIAGTWRLSTLDSEEDQLTAKDRQALNDFIGGSPVRSTDEQLRLEFGTAR